MKDVPFGHVQHMLDIKRSQSICVDDRFPKVRGVRSDSIDHVINQILLSCVHPAFVWGILNQALDHVPTRWRQGIVIHTRYHQINEKVVAE